MGGGKSGLFKGTKGSLYIKKGQQDKHIPGTNNYKQELAKGVHKSILTADPERLLREFAGKGERISPTKERINFGEIIGRYYDPKTQQYYDTTWGIIHYDNNGGAHIVPAYPRGDLLP